MPAEQITDDELRRHIYENKWVVVKFDPRTDCEACTVFAPVYESISTRGEFAHISFFTMYSDSNPTAQQLILENKRPFVVIYKNGMVIGSGLVGSENEMEEMLNRTKLVKIKI